MATGVSAKEGPGGGTNHASLEMLKSYWGVTPGYYCKGKKPSIPLPLVRAGIGAEILGPPPVDAEAFMKLADLKRGIGQYLDADANNGNTKRFSPFAPDFVGSPSDYPPSAFREWAPRTPGIIPDFSQRHPGSVEKVLHESQPAMLFQEAKKLDDFLNNQSLVILFTWKGKKLLFAGDAQAGNWLYWLFDLDKPSKTPGQADLSEHGASILSSLDFYKVGHHGSTNATPLSVVEALGDGFAALCPTEADSFGDPEKASEVPRIPLLEALARKGAVVRSDQFPARVGEESVPATKGTTRKLPTPKQGRFELGPCYVDYFV